MKNREKAMKLLNLGEFSKEEKMRKIEHQNFIYSYLVDDSYKLVQDNDPGTKEFEELDNHINPHNNRLVKRLDRSTEWGLGGEILKRKKNHFTPKKIPSPHEVTTLFI